MELLAENHLKQLVRFIESNDNVYARMAIAHGEDIGRPWEVRISFKPKRTLQRDVITGYGMTASAAVTHASLLIAGYLEKTSQELASELFIKGE